MEAAAVYNTLMEEHENRGESGLFAVAQARDAARKNALALAFVGDTVYDMFVRTRLVQGTELPVRTLHRRASARVCAAAQAKAFRRIEALLDAEELSVYRRGRNAHPATVPRNADVVDYRVATGLEALLGMLYLRGDLRRLSFLMDEILREDEADG